MPASPSSGAHSTSPAAPSSTSTRVSPVSSALSSSASASATARKPCRRTRWSLTMIGAALLWVGWFGFNVGSDLEANQFAGQVFINTFVATCAAALSWMIVEWIAKGKPSALGLASGVVAGLVAITPACGFCRRDGLDRSRPRRQPDLLLLLLGDQERAWLRRQPGCLRRPLHRRHHRCSRYRSSGQSRLGWRRHRRLPLEARRADDRHLRHGRADDCIRPKPSA